MRFHFALKKEAEEPSEIFASCHITTRCYSPEDHDLNIPGRENVKCRSI